MNLPVLGLDYGTVRIGVAISDALGIAARPLCAISVDGEEVAALGTLAETNGARGIVVGLPTTLKGHEGTSAEGARQLGEALAASTGLPIEFADERFTTARAESLLKGTVRDRRERREKIDAAAASVMLQGWLDARAAKQRGNPRYT